MYKTKIKIMKLLSKSEFYVVFLPNVSMFNNFTRKNETADQFSSVNFPRHQNLKFLNEHSYPFMDVGQ